MIAKIAKEFLLRGLGVFFLASFAFNAFPYVQMKSALSNSPHCLL